MPRPSLRTPGTLLLAGVSTLVSSCMFHHTPMVFNPPPPRAQPKIKPAPPPELPAPPQIATDLASMVPPAIAPSIPELAAPPAPKPAPRRTVVTAPPKPSAPAATEQTPPPPRLVQLFTPEQEREYNHNIDENLGKVNRALAILSRKNLNPDQAESANRISAFQKQAEQARAAHDLASADLLARRAATLADDLLTRVP